MKRNDFEMRFHFNCTYSQAISLLNQANENTGEDVRENSFKKSHTLEGP